jgi:hypothetical protein
MLNKMKKCNCEIDKQQLITCWKEKALMGEPNVVCMTCGNFLYDWGDESGIKENEKI